MGTEARGRGQGRRRTARRRTKLSAFALPGGRVPGRRQAVTKAGEVPSQTKSGTEPSRREEGLRERACLLALGRCISMSEVEHPGGGPSGELARQGATKAMGSRERSCWSTRWSSWAKVVYLPGRCVPGPAAPRGARQHGVVRATLGIIAVRIPGGNVIDTLRQEVTERVVDRGRRPRGLHRRGKACGEAHLAIDTTQPEGATVGRQGSAFASRSHGSASDRRKPPLCWSRMSQKHTSWGL